MYANDARQLVEEFEASVKIEPMLADIKKAASEGKRYVNLDVFLLTTNVQKALENRGFKVTVHRRHDDQRITGWMVSW